MAMADGPQEAPALHNPAGVAEGKEAVQGAAEVGAAPPLPEAVRRGRWQKRYLLPEAQEPPGLKTPPAAGGSGAACASMPALHNPVGAASTAVATSPAVHVLSPRGLTSAAPRPLEPPAGLALPPAGPPPASGTQASEDPVAAAGATQALVPQRGTCGGRCGPWGASAWTVPRRCSAPQSWGLPLAAQAGACSVEQPVRDRSAGSGGAGVRLA